MKKVIVVGGGLVGSLAAITFNRQGHQVEVFEKRPDPRIASKDQGRSINLIITSRGIEALKQVDLWESVRPLTSPVFGRQMHDKAGQQIYQAYGKDGECNYSISRSALNQCLLSHCESLKIPLHFSHTLEQAKLSEKRLHFNAPKGELIVGYEFLIGTDGAGSVLRSAMKEAHGEKYHESITPLSADYKELFLPLSPQGQAQLDTKALHIWPRGTHMLMALPNLDSSFTMTLYLPKMGGPNSFAELTTKEKVEAFMRTEFPDALALMPQAVNEFMQNPQGHLATVRSAPWIFNDSVVLLGDAAHAIVPFFGQGMNLGFEDVTYLQKFLQQNPNDWKQALQQFDNFQRPNANAIAEMALENFEEMRDKVGDQQFLLKKKLESKIEAELPQLYKSRYRMITYSLIPYALCQQAGLIQEEILQQLLQEGQTAEQFNLEKVKAVLEKKLKLPPYPVG